MISKKAKMDYKELARLVANDLGGDVPDEVKKALNVGRPKGPAEWAAIAVVGQFVLRLAECAIKLNGEANTRAQNSGDGRRGHQNR